MTRILVVFFASVLVGCLFLTTLHQEWSSSSRDDEKLSPQRLQRRRLTESTPVADFPPEWEPLNCTEYTTFQDPTIDPNNGELIARWTSVEPPFWFSVHNILYDPMRLKIYNHGFYYEVDQTSIFGQILEKAPPHARVLDVGGNIGWFTMLSASKGYHVDVFEPNRKNIVRMCQSAWLNEWTTATDGEVGKRTEKKSSVNIRKYGVGSERSKLVMYQGRNPGKFSFVRDMLPKKNIPVSASDELPIITLDDMATELGWFDNKMTKFAIMKVDVEGFEPQVFQGAKKLLGSDKIDNILMEMSSMENNTNNLEMLRLIVNSGYYLKQQGGMGPGSGDVPETTPELPEKLMKKIGYKVGLQTNLWWKRKGQFDYFS